MKMSLAQLAAASGATLEGAAAAAGNTVFTRLSIDSRTVEAGDVFLCLPGERFDGHDFAKQAAERGAAAFIAQQELASISAPVVRVGSSRQALLAIARQWRTMASSKVAAITGTAGKTTIKELLAQVLAGQFSVAKTPKNNNNQVGLPLAMLSATGQEDVWVLELGISQPHDMAELAPVAAPDLAVIHNVGPCHLDGLCDIAGVAQAKAQLLAHVRSGATALANVDYPELWSAAQRACPTVKPISTRDAGVAYFCSYLGVAPAGTGQSAEGLPVQSPAGGVFLLRLGGERLELRLPFVGAHYAENIVAVSAAAYELGMAPGAIADALASARLPQQRFQARPIGRHLLIDDSYNANPLSMAGAVQAIAAMANGQKGGMAAILVLGDMLELGDRAGSEHVALGRTIAAAGVRAVYYRGVHAGDVRQGLLQGGFAGMFAAVDNPGELDSHLKNISDSGETGIVVLVKGSRGSRMEEFIPVLEAAMRPAAAAEEGDAA